MHHARFSGLDTSSSIPSACLRPNHSTNGEVHEAVRSRFCLLHCNRPARPVFGLNYDQNLAALRSLARPRRGSSTGLRSRVGRVFFHFAKPRAEGSHAYKKALIENKGGFFIEGWSDTHRPLESYFS